MEAADWASLSDQELLEIADQGFQILDQMEGDGPSRAR
jgi:hypothetical protein